MSPLMLWLGASALAATLRVDVALAPSDDLPDELALADAGHTTWAYTLADAPDRAPRFVPLPITARDAWCTSTVGERSVPGVRTPDGCWLLSPHAAGAGPVTHAWGWRQDGLVLIGEVRPDLVASVSGATISLAGEGVQFATAVSGVGAVVGQPGSAVATLGASWPAVDDGYAVVAGPVFTWRVVSLGDRAALDSRAEVLERLARRGIDASMPEPAVPLRFKNRKATPEFVSELVVDVQDAFVDRTLPASRPLQPRKLVAARKTGFASDWEQALLLTRYLRQMKRDALPVPVRPRTAGSTDGLTPVGYTTAAVRLRGPAGDQWIAPACGMCGVGELPPELWDGEALGEDVSRLPTAPESHNVRELRVVDGAPGTLAMSLEGPVALAIRTGLRDVPVDARVAWLEAATGVAGCRLLSHTGLADRGAPMTLEFSVPAGVVSLPAPLAPAAFAGAPILRMPWRGDWRDRIVGLPAPAPDVQLSGEGIAFTRLTDSQGVQTERWTVDAIELERASVAPLLRAVLVRRGRR